MFYKNVIAIIKYSLFRLNEIKISENYVYEVSLIINLFLHYLSKYNKQATKKIKTTPVCLSKNVVCLIYNVRTDLITVTEFCFVG